MEEKYKKNISKLMSLALRHDPNALNISLNEMGWAKTDELLNGLQTKGFDISLVDLKEIVDTNDKKRFSFNEDFGLIRANQGHSLNVNIEFKSLEPPVVLYHGTIQKFMSEIRDKGLLKISRQHVHLSEQKDTAEKAGARRGKPIILVIKAQLMHKNGYQFFKSENGVWLTDRVPPEYIK